MSCLLCSTYYLNQGIPLPRQTKRTVFRDCPFPIIVVNKTIRRVLLYINLIGINVIIIIIITQNYILYSRLFYKCKTQMPPGWTEMTRSLHLVLILSFLLHWKKYDEIFTYLLPRIFSANCFPNPLFISETIEHKT